MTDNTVRILNPPTPEMMKDPVALYRFLLEIYNRTGGAKPTGKDLSGLTASVKQLNTLNGVNLGESIQDQLNGKIGGKIIYSP